MTTQQLRTRFLAYFESRGHTQIPSSPLVPVQDPTLLFTNAGMVQFKDIFAGREVAPYPCAVSVQRCLRAGGKHNDLENVGYTARHHTFFEMLGNFSFGAYFKREAIQYAWTFLTEILQIPAQRLWVTVFEKDQEAESIWRNEMKIDPTRFSRCGEADNFWAMGDTGPCGPCTEIFYDHGPHVAGGPPGSPEAAGDRYVEIWNLVFMQYERSAAGQLIPLPTPCVDTGMGLERLAAVMQGVVNNYETDLFQPLIQAVTQILGQKAAPLSALRVIADHLRAAAFLITDNVIPSNEGRGYVLRRLIRRAVRHGYQLGTHTPFLHQLVPVLIAQMGPTYPELTHAKDLVTQRLLQEEEQFSRTLHQGMQWFEQMIATLTGTVISGEMVFKLYDTYGFPTDLTADLARERGLTLDQAGFEQAMAAQQQRSQASSTFSATPLTSVTIDEPTHFSGYETLTQTTRVIALLKTGKPTNQLLSGESGTVILESSPFYAEAGGQVGDQGQLCTDDALFVVTDTQKQGTTWLHIGHMQHGTLTLDSQLTAAVDVTRRQAIARNHSATHLLHAALRQVLGKHVLQKGSLVTPTHLRFDFSCPVAITEAHIEQVEQQVNQQILENLAVNTRLMSPADAQAAGAIALFGEKYDIEVRVLSLGEFSLELCGGTHVRQTSEIGLFKISASTGIAAGVRRLEAVTGKQAFKFLKSLEQALSAIAVALKTDRHHILPKLKKQQEILQQQRHDMTRLYHYLRNTLVDTLLPQTVQLQTISLLIAEVPAIAAPELRALIDQLKRKLPPAVVIVLTCITADNTVQLSVGVSQACIEKGIKAQTLATALAPTIGGKGGGRADFAQIFGCNPTGVVMALKSVQPWVENELIH